MKFRPLHDRVLLERMEEDSKTAGGIIIPDSAKEKPMKGKIVAVGSGMRDESGKLVPLDVKEGDVVLFSKWSGTEVNMSEVADQSFVFDKAEGRVVETVGFLSASDTDRTIKFYETALPQLGWKPLKTAIFERNNEQLVVRAEKVAQGQLVRFQLSPVSR